MKGHKNFDFVDVSLKSDTRLFIDPCLIERANDTWSLEAAKVMNIFFDCLFQAFQTGDPNYIYPLLAHAGEQNATRLGFGTGENGKGKTERGMFESLRELSRLSRNIPTIGKVQDIPVFVKGVAEDCLSDLLTNILYEQLNAFTAQQMAKWKYPTQGEKMFWTFDAGNRQWIQVVRPTWFLDGKEILLVPKWIVRKNFLFKARQYLNAVIIERIRDDNGWQDLKKIDVWNNFPRIGPHWEYEKVIEYTREHPDVLLEYHRKIPQYYKRKNGIMLDDDLDKVVYAQILAITQEK